MDHPNPYEPPVAPPDPIVPAPSRRSVGAMVVMALLSIPAGGIAFFATCYATVLVVDSRGGSIDDLLGWGLFTGLIGGGLAMGLVLYYGVFRKPRDVKTDENPR